MQILQTISNISIETAKGILQHTRGTSNKSMEQNCIMYDIIILHTMLWQTCGIADFTKSTEKLLIP